MQSRALRLLASAAALFTTAATAADDVQRQLQQREIQQLELRLKMQQQADRAAQPPTTPAANLIQRQVERDQLQRLQQLQDQEARGMIAPAPVSGAGTLGETGKPRGLDAGAEQLRRFDAERRGARN